MLSTSVFFFVWKFYCVKEGVSMVRSYVWLTVCVILWGSNFVFGKILVQYFSPSMLTTLRLLCIVLFLFILQPVYRSQRQVMQRRDLVALIFLGIVGVFVNQWSFFIGLETADPTIAALILALTPIVTAFLAVIFLREKISIRMVIGSAIAIVGIFYVVTNGSLATVQVDEGLGWIVLTMVAFAIMIIMTRFLVQRINPFYITLYSTVVGLIVSLPFAFLYDKEVIISTNVAPWLLLVVTAVIVHGLANLLWNQHIQSVQASKASILCNLEPFVAMVVGFILLAKPVTMIELLGGIFIVSGVVFSTYERGRRQKALLK